MPDNTYQKIIRRVYNEHSPHESRSAADEMVDEMVCELGDCTCKTCAFWKPDRKLCGRDGWWEMSDDAAWGMMPAQGAPESAPHHCGPNYGCIHHKPKDNHAP